MKNALPLCIFVLTAFIKLGAQTTVPAIISSSQVWDLSGSPYQINQNTYIDSGAHITVMPGVRIESATGFNLMVAGGFTAKGKWDSLIRISNVFLTFYADSKGYNFTTGAGSQFKYCHLNGAGLSFSKAVITTACALKIDQCQFSNLMDGIQTEGTWLNPYRLDVLNSGFEGANINYGYLIRSRSRYVDFNIHNCDFKNAGNLFVDGKVKFTGNRVYKVNSMYCYFYDSTVIQCNRFVRMNYGLNFNYYDADLVDFSYNTLDSLGSGSFYPMLQFNYGNKNNTRFSENNFLSNTGTERKIKITQNNPTPAKTDTLDFKNNYWGSSDSATIESYITDYADNINLFGRADISGFYKNPLISCSNPKLCAEARFTYEISDSTVLFKDSSTGNAFYKVRWTFGDGNSNDQNEKQVSHQYSLAGNYLVCLYAYDTLNNLCDSVCQTIVIAEVEGCIAQYYFAADTSLPMMLYLVNNSEMLNPDTEHSWTFGDGAVSALKNPVHTYVAKGRYTICMGLSDLPSNCSSSFCDSVDLNLDGMTLRVISEDDITRIRRRAYIGAVNVYPNPGGGLFTIDFNVYENTRVSLSVMSSTGLQVYNTLSEAEAGSQQLRLDLSDFAPGLYLLNIRSGNALQQVRIVIQ